MWLRLGKAERGGQPRYTPSFTQHFVEVEWLRKKATDLPDKFRGASVAQLRRVALR
jgi:hypothetical protein